LLLKFTAGGRWRSLAVALLAFAGADAAHAAGDAGKAYTVANYPVEARAQDAVRAKEKALADGQQGALRALLKRLVPVTAYTRLQKLAPAPAKDMLEAFAVKKETNSQTDYIATLDFIFSAKAVQAYLRANGIAFVDEQAEPVVLVPVWHTASVGKAAAPMPAPLSAGGKAWSEAWRGLDLDHALSPAAVKPLKSEIHADAISQLAGGDLSALRIFTGEYNTQNLVVAIAEPDASGRKLIISYVGEDAVGPIYLRRTYRIQGGDLAYTAEYAAVVGLGVLEGRWKAIRAGMQPASAAPVAEELQFTVEFNGLGEWDRISRRISAIPGVSQLQPVTLSSQGGEVKLLYGGGMEDLQRALFPQGLYLQNRGGAWILVSN